MRDDRQLGLLTWTPPAAVVIPFPMAKRTGKVRDVASKLLSKTTDRAVDHYRRQVTEGILANLTSRHIPAQMHDQQIAAFWLAVECEINRQVYGRNPGSGGAA
jgi:hypothetical protein